MSVRRVVRIVVRGQVQGVGFRAWTQHQGELHGLEGWVRNRRDGTVEAVLAGAPDAIELVLKACRQGPRGSTVEAVEVRDDDERALAERGGAHGFAVLTTA